MESKIKYLISKTLGEDFAEVLIKTELYKPGVRAVVDDQEIYTALKIVPKTIMSFLIKELSSMKTGDHKDVNLPVPGAVLRVNKVERDCFNGQLEQDNKKIAEFINRSIPGIGLYILSTFELYQIEELEKPAPRLQDTEYAIQKLINDRLDLYSLINQVVDKKMMEREAIDQLIFKKITDSLHSLEKKSKGIEEVTKIQKQSADSDEYNRGMANGLVVADSIVNEKEPVFVEPKEKGAEKLKKFINSKKNKANSREFKIELSKSESIECPDCKQNIFDKGVYSGCLCFGDNKNSKVFMRKNENGTISLRFSKNWDIENIEMLLELLRKKR